MGVQRTLANPPRWTGPAGIANESQETRRMASRQNQSVGLATLTAAREDWKLENKDLGSGYENVTSRQLSSQESDPTVGLTAAKGSADH